MAIIQPRRGLIGIVVVLLVCISLAITVHLRNMTGSFRDIIGQQGEVPLHILHGDAIASKLGNETAKYVGSWTSYRTRTVGLNAIRAELGRAAWKVLHTTMARFPDKPTPDESTALRSYILLFARLYPW